MKKIMIGIILMLVIGFPDLLKSQETFALGESSRVTIHGKTNINTFDCKYSFDETKNTPSFHTTESSDHVVIKDVNLKIPIEQCECGNKLLNKDFRATLEAEKHPYIDINISRLIFKKTQDKDRERKVWANLTIGGVTKWKQIDYSVKYNNDGVFYMKGQFHINTQNFNIEKRKRFLGMVKVNDNVDISFLFKFVKNQ
ncbi:MAG: YceI family protein [Bacteroidales bacterium]|nr:YceI family protein [Bacteroidales bacterium]MCF8336904.1 YceI family protein [Bacteroidales bacterium]